MPGDDTTGSAASTRGFAALRQREFAIFVFSKLLVFASHHMFMVAVAYQIYDLTGDALALAYVNLVMICPTLLFVLLTGYVSDRFDRRTVLIVGYGTMALSSAGLLLVSYLDLIVSHWVYVVLFVNATARAFANPAANAIIPNLVPRDCFPNAVAWNVITNRISQIGGPALGGIIYLLGPEVVYATAAICCIAGTMSVARIGRRASGVSNKKTSIGEMLAGAVFVYRNKLILGALLVDLIVVLTASVNAVLPIIAKDLLEVGPAGAGALRSAMALGGLLSALGMTRYPITRQAGPLMFAGAALLSAGAIAIGLSHWFVLSLAIMALMGAADMFSVNIRHTLIQVATPDNMRGRVSAVSAVMANSGTELGGFRAGLMAGAIGIVPSIIFGGVAGVLLVGLCWKLYPEVARIQRVDRLE